MLLHPIARVYDRNPVKRSVVLLVALGFLSGMGMPLRRPCCAIVELASTVSSPDCCPMPDCCRGEKRGATPIVLSSKSAGVTPLPLFTGPTPAFVWPSTSLGVGFFATETMTSVHGPPEATRNLSLLLSTLRV